MTHTSVRLRPPVSTGHRWSTTSRWVTAVLALAWTTLLGWSVYQIVLTRMSEADNEWVWPDVAALVILLIVSIGAIGACSASRSAVRKLMAVVLVTALVILGGVIWAARAPLPELRAVPVPPSGAAPEQIVQSFVAALDAHDQATAKALSVPDTPPRGQLDDNVRVKIVHIGPISPTTAYVPGRNGTVSGLDVEVQLAGRTRSGGLPGEGGTWEYVLAPVGPQNAWRVVDDGTG
jgi:hypothetical protein